MRKIFTILLGALLLVGCADKKEKVRIACIGDSITEGYGLRCQSQSSYPYKLNQMLGDNYIVQNCGRSATTLQKQGDYSYWTVCDFMNALQLQPNIVVIALGTNDTKTYNWNQERFKKDYQNLIDTIQSIPSKPQIILVKPVPAFETKWTINDSTLVNGVNPVIDELQVQYKLHVIDMHDAFLGEAENFVDSIHPNEIAVYKMAEMVYKEIKNIEK